MASKAQFTFQQLASHKILAKWAAQDVLHGKCESGAENDTCETKGAIDT